ncbi:MAG: hypothetical protein WBA63_05305 [Thermomicrobiales bacterium]
MSSSLEWSLLPQASPESPILSLLPTPEGLWAGGIGTLARREPSGIWNQYRIEPGLRTVLALEKAGTTILAAGTGGIARSADGGTTWHPAQGIEHLTILSLACSPAYDRDQTILAGTAGDGVLRSTDGGITWTSAQFGMQATEVSGLLWPQDKTVYATTPAGLYRSTNEGRSWQLLIDRSFAFLDQRDDVMMALGMDGIVWRSPDAGDHWDALGPLPAGAEVQAFAMLANGSLLIGTVEHGTLCSLDGTTWTPCGDHSVLTVAIHGDTLFAGTTDGVLECTGAPALEQWQSLGSPPLADYCRIHTLGDAIFVSGVLSRPQRWTPTEGWITLENCPVPTRIFAEGWDGELIAGTPDGVFASTDRGETWHQLSRVPGGDWLTIRADGAGWMATVDGTSVVITRDRGHTWSPLRPPFGVFPIIALQAPSEAGGSPLLAVTFDVTRHSAILWRSFDDGETWERGSEASSSSPEISTLADPLAISLGNAIMLRDGDGRWIRTQPGNGTIRRLAASASGLVALTHDGLWFKRPDEPAWWELPAPEGNGEIVDVSLDGDALVILLTGNELRSCHLGALTAAATP